MTASPPSDGESIVIGIKQVQMEQDTAKTLQQPPSTALLDFNRVSHPLIEIITMPCIHHPATAAACVRKLQALLRAVGACTRGMELGGLRCDVNVSVRKRHEPFTDAGGKGHEYAGVKGLGQRTEIKNLSSLRAVEDAIVAERDRQIRILEAGGVIEGETRGWALGSTETRRLRGKEGEVDYRYMPDPTWPPVLVGEGLLDRMRESMPRLPDELLDVLTGEDGGYGMSIKDAKTLIGMDEGERLEYYFEAVERLGGLLTNEERKMVRGGVGRVVGNWVVHELTGLLTSADVQFDPTRVSAGNLASIIASVVKREVTGTTAKSLLATVFAGDERSVEQIIEEDNLRLRPMGDEEYVAMGKSLVEENPEMVRAIKVKGQKGKIMWFVGQMLKIGEEGRVEAKRAEETMRKLVDIE